MPFYTGSTADGSDMREVKGMYVSDDGNSWSNYPTTKNHRLADQVFDHIEGKRSYRDEYNLIMKKESKLPKAARDYVVHVVENFKEDDTIGES